MPGYLGNKFGMIVYHLAVMVPKCKIYDIKKEDSVYFVPDILDQARKNLSHANTVLINYLN
jgi:hypothetical protein